MISYELFTRLRHLVDQAHWKLQAVTRELGLNIKTVRLWAKRIRYERKRRGPRSSKLDPFKNDLVRLLAEHPYSSAQLLLRLREAGYTGGVSILRTYCGPSPSKEIFGLSDVDISTGRMCPGRLGICGRRAGGTDPSPLELFRHGPGV